MAGHLYIRNITKDQLTDLHNAGGYMEDTIFHYDKEYAATSPLLVAQEGAAVQNRKGLPAHCYITFQRNKTDQNLLRGIAATLGALTKPAGIIASNQNLNPWPGVNAGDTLWNALQRGSVIIEFYQFDGEEVRTAIPWNPHAAVPKYMKRLTEDLVEVYD